jgi:hypothetical protein
MSKKTETAATAESTETEKTESVQETVKKTTVKKIGVVRYLQTHPMDSYLASLMKKNYTMQVKTESEWDEIAGNLAKQKY